MGKILVTGATGNIGSQLVLRLKEKSLEVIAGVSSLSNGSKKKVWRLSPASAAYPRPAVFPNKAPIRPSSISLNPKPWKPPSMGSIDCSSCCRWWNPWGIGGCGL
jgi:hypothetical protein